MVVTTGVTRMTTVTPTFLDMLTLYQSGEEQFSQINNINNDRLKTAKKN